jgi:hypothetical protein
MATLVNVGSFAKSVGAAPAAQVIPHGLGATPTAVIFWMSGQTTADTFGAGALASIGFVTAGNVFSGAAGMIDAQATSVTSQRLAAKAITIVTGAESTLAEADLTTLDATNITLSWSTNDSNAYLINFIALGGDIDAAEVINWQMPATASPTEVAVTGFGFEPDCLLTVNVALTTPDTSGVFADHSLSVAVKGGADWGISFRDADTAATMDTQRAFFGLPIQATATNEAAYVAGHIQKWDADGFTACITTTLNGAEAITLGLKGGTYRSGVFMKTDNAATATQKISSLPVTPRGILLGTVMHPDRYVSVAEARWGLGASDGTDERASVILSQNNSANSNVDNYMASTKALVIANNNTPVVEAACDAVFSGRNVSLSWTTNDAVHTMIGFLIFGDENQ